MEDHLRKQESESIISRILSKIVSKERIDYKSIGKEEESQCSRNSQINNHPHKLCRSLISRKSFLDR